MILVIRGPWYEVLATLEFLAQTQGARTVKEIAEGGPSGSKSNHTGEIITAS